MSVTTWTRIEPDILTGDPQKDLTLGIAADQDWRREFCEELLLHGLAERLHDGLLDLEYVLGPLCPQCKRQLVEMRVQVDLGR